MPPPGFATAPNPKARGRVYAKACEIVSLAQARARKVYHESAGVKALPFNHQSKVIMSKFMKDRYIDIDVKINVSSSTMSRKRIRGHRKATLALISPEIFTIF